MTSRQAAARNAGQALAHQAHTAAEHGADSEQGVQAATDANQAVAAATHAGATVGEIVTAGLNHLPPRHA